MSSRGHPRDGDSTSHIHGPASAGTATDNRRNRGQRRTVKADGVDGSGGETTLARCTVCKGGDFVWQPLTGVTDSEQ